MLSLADLWISALDTKEEERRRVGKHIDIPEYTTMQKKDYRGEASYVGKPIAAMNFYEFVGSMITHDKYVHGVDESVRGPIPRHSLFYEWVYILQNAFVPVLIQQLWYWFTDSQWSWSFAMGFYFFGILLSSLRNISHFGFYMKKYGTFDQQNVGRDPVSDMNVVDVVTAILRFFGGRVTAEVLFFYNKSEQPINNFTWTFPFRAMLYLCVMDYFFYCYHRLTHDIDWLWAVHARHHTSRHPTPGLSILADDLQEVIETFLVPFAAAALVPMTFHELFVTHIITIYTEMLGHTGIRADWELPLIGPVLRLLGLELQIEDHDLHHRYGKSGLNYGKQTRMYDVLFGTTVPREEMAGRLTREF